MNPMNETKSSLATRLVLGGGAIAVLGNALGACVMFLYFSLVESGLTVPGRSRDLESNFLFFLVASGAIIGLVSIIAYLILRPLREDLVRLVSRQEVDNPQALAGRYLNLPIYVSGTSLLGWLLSGFVFTFMPPAFEQLHYGDVRLALRTLFGNYVVGAPTTVAFIYFVLEWQVRKNILALFPPETLVEVPRAFKTNVLPKMLLVSFMIGAVPLSIVSFLTLDQISQIQANKDHIDVFTAQMPLVVVFLFCLAVVTIAVLSYLMSRSVSEPIRSVSNAMRMIGKGDLNVSIPVVSNDEIGVMAAGFNRMVEGLRERDLIRETFGSYVSQEVAAEILQAPDGVRLRGELRDISILVADLRGFTHLSAQLEPQLVLRIINGYLEKMTEVIVQHAGTIDEIMGDGILVFFGAPREVPDHPRRAVECALTMQRALERLNREHGTQGLPELAMGIGINCGELVVGSIGSEKRRKYGAMGSPINAAYRVEAQTAGGEILVTPAIYERLHGGLIVHSHRVVILKGFEDPVTLYHVAGIKSA